MNVEQSKTGSSSNGWGRKCGVPNCSVKREDLSFGCLICNVGLCKKHVVNVKHEDGSRINLCPSCSPRYKNDPNFDKADDEDMRTGSPGEKQSKLQLPKTVEDAPVDNILFSKGLEASNDTVANEQTSSSQHPSSFNPPKYSCGIDGCRRMFTSRSGMASHKRQAHPLQWHKANKTSGEAIFSKAEESSFHLTKEPIPLTMVNSIENASNGMIDDEMEAEKALDFARIQQSSSQQQHQLHQPKKKTNRRGASTRRTFTNEEKVNIICEYEQWQHEKGYVPSANPTEYVLEKGLPDSFRKKLSTCMGGWRHPDYRNYLMQKMAQEEYSKLLNRKSIPRKAIQLFSSSDEYMIKRERKPRKASEKKRNFSAGPSHYGLVSSCKRVLKVKDYEEITKDEVRTQSYFYAIESNKEIIKDKVVLEVGCGTGLLSMFCARVGAAKVIAIESSEMALMAEKNVEANDLSDIVKVVYSRCEDIAELPDDIQQVDVIISEWMGFFLLHQSSLESVIYCRNRWLSPNGMMLPDKAVLKIAAVEDDLYRREKLDFWNELYGFNMKAVKEAALMEPSMECISEESIISDHAAIFELDLTTCTTLDQSFVSKFQLIFTRDDYVHGIISYFDCLFSSVSVPQFFSTAPGLTPTHWKQTTFYFSEPVKVVKGGVLSGQISFMMNEENCFASDVSIDGNFIRWIDDKLTVSQRYRLS